MRINGCATHSCWCSPCVERAVRQATSDLADRFCPDLIPGELYDLASMVVPIPTKSDLPAMAIRMTSLPTSLSKEEIESWVHRLKRVSATTAVALTDSRESLAPGANPPKTGD